MRRPPAPVSTSRALRAPGELGLIVTANVAVSPAASVVGPPVVIANAPSASPTIVACAIVIGSVANVRDHDRARRVRSLGHRAELDLADRRRDPRRAGRGTGSGGVVVPLPVPCRCRVPAGRRRRRPRAGVRRRRRGAAAGVARRAAVVRAAARRAAGVVPRRRPPCVVPPDDVSGGVVVVVCCVVSAGVVVVVLSVEPAFSGIEPSSASVMPCSASFARSSASGSWQPPPRGSCMRLTRVTGTAVAATASGGVGLLRVVGEVGERRRLQRRGRGLIGHHRLGVDAVLDDRRLRKRIGLRLRRFVESDVDGVLGVVALDDRELHRARLARGCVGSARTPVPGDDRMTNRVRRSLPRGRSPEQRE